MYTQYKKYYTQLQQNGDYRSLPPYTLHQKHCIDFSSNDYLALSTSPLLHKAALLASQQFGASATGSRLLSGNTPIFSDLENLIAKDKHTEAALIFNSGFQANSNVLATLLDPAILGAKPLVFFDKLNHASLYQAVFLSQCELIRYNHNNMEHLNELLLKYQQTLRPKFIITETVFGMDGDKAPLDKIIRLAKQHSAFLYLDEAHATGIFGSEGYGVSTDFNLQDIPHVIMGTFGKALGCFGAYIACSEIIKNYLINKCPGFIYSTALPPMIIGAATQAWQLVRTFKKEREVLLSKAEDVRNKLQSLGLNTGISTTHIMPIIIGEKERVMHSKNILFQKNIIVSAIRAPTVPPGTNRLRIALTLHHSDSDLEQLLDAMEKL